MDVHFKLILNILVLVDTIYQGRTKINTPEIIIYLHTQTLG